ncbi:AraC family transcriptional regulator ligand-binding domain-containing protein [Sneathiella sp.]|uniref:AraC family transcriptional regulator n=1 Tax=Sneathiella sp. TaxID=1964365 RepID=UPI003569CBC3
MMRRQLSQAVSDLAEKHVIPAVHLFRLMEVARKHGFDTDWMYAKIGAAPADFQKKDATCTVGHRLRLLSAIRETEPIPGLGLMVGRRIKVSDHGIVGYAILSSANMGCALEIVSRYHQLSNPTVRFNYHIIGEETRLTEAPIFPFDDFAARYHLEEMLAAWIPIGALLQRGSLDFQELRLPWSKPDYHNLYEEMFQCPIRYNQSDCGAHLPTSRLRERISLADPELAMLCEQQCDIIAHGDYDTQRLGYQVQRILLGQPGQFPTIDHVAGLLNMSERSLRRSLAMESTSFSQILEKLRLRIATRYLQDTEIPAHSIAALLGYSAPANFHRFFKRTTGVTPEEFRRDERPTDDKVPPAI